MNSYLKRQYYRLRTTTFRDLAQQFLKPTIQEGMLLWLLGKIYQYDATSIKYLNKAIYLKNYLDKHGIILQGKSILDYGSGQSQCLMRLMMMHGARKTYTFDRYINSGNDIKYTKNIKKWLQVINIFPLDNIDQTKVIHVSSLSDIPEESIDLIVSFSVLEHISQPDEEINVLCNVLSPGGLMVHFIDFRDHSDFSKPLDFLQYDQKTWHSMNPSNVFTHTNRYRLCDFEQLFKQKGMNVVFTEVMEKHVISSNDCLDFHPYFQKYSERDLAALSAIVVAQKK